MKEEFKEVKGYEGLYWISNLGTLKNKRRILKPSINTYGYLQTGLTKNGKRKSYLIHRLVALAFLPNPNNLSQINHKDENKINNCVDNLEWCDQSYNMSYGTFRGRVSFSQRNDSNRSKPVLQYDKNGNFIKEYPSVSEVQR